MRSRRGFGLFSLGGLAEAGVGQVLAGDAGFGPELLEVLDADDAEVVGGLFCLGFSGLCGSGWIKGFCLGGRTSVLGRLRRWFLLGG